jgi:hypothetical protein
MKRFNVKDVVALVLLAALAGCAPKAIRVRCDAHLVPINPSMERTSNDPPKAGASGRSKGAHP